MSSTICAPLSPKLGDSLPRSSLATDLSHVARVGYINFLHLIRSKKIKIKIIGCSCITRLDDSPGVCFSYSGFDLPSRVEMLVHLGQCSTLVHRYSSFIRLELFEGEQMLNHLGPVWHSAVSCWLLAGCISCILIVVCISGLC